MDIALQLLGSPRALRGGERVAPRGHKVWGLLAYLALQPAGASRRHLAGLLFADAEDPLAALRWNLTELRRVLGDDTLRGDPVALPRDTLPCIDIVVLAHGDCSAGLALPGLGGELLEGCSFAGCPAFEVWLQGQRRRAEALTGAVLREAALARLAEGASADAAALARRLVALNALDENFQVLLVRCLAAAGDGLGAARQAAACRALFERELGVAPGPALLDALRTSTAAPTARPSGGRAAALAQLEAGEAAIGAGVLDAGLQCLRRAIVDADATGDPVLCTRTRIALGSALVHAARGRDEEGAAALHEALRSGRGAAPELAASACRELGYVEFLGARYERALAWLDQALGLAGDSRAEQARIATVQGAVLSDQAHYAAAFERLGWALERAREADDPRQALYAESMIGRACWLTGQTERAAQLLRRNVEAARRAWTAFLPWPQSFLAETELAAGQVDAAAERLEQAFALGCQLGDPCWQGIAGRGLGLVAMARGRPDDARSHFRDALDRIARLPDAYLWGRAYVLDAQCRLELHTHGNDAVRVVGELLDLAQRSGMRELIVRACRHRAQLGDTAAALAAEPLAEEIDNPALCVTPSPPPLAPPPAPARSARP